MPFTCVSVYLQGVLLPAHACIPHTSTERALLLSTTGLSLPISIPCCDASKRRTPGPQCRVTEEARFTGASGLLALLQEGDVHCASTLRSTLRLCTAHKNRVMKICTSVKTCTRLQKHSHRHTRVLFSSQAHRTFALKSQ